MKCFELQRPDGVEGLRLVDKPTPNPGRGQVLVRVKAATLNYRDLLTIKGGYASRQKFPLIPVSDGAGVVEYSFADDDANRVPRLCTKEARTPGVRAEKKKRNGIRRFSPVVAEYVYHQADGTPYLRVQRTAAKDFIQYHWDGKEWIKGKPNGPKIPYRLPELIAAALTTPIYIVEGEKDADNLAKIFLVATCNSGGADNGSGGKWTSDLNEHFRDRVVCILPDNDAPDRKHADHVARNLHPVAKSVQVVQLPDLEPKGDVSDWLRSE